MSEEIPQFRYLNTDLVLNAPYDLTPLTIALDGLGVFTMSVVQYDDGNCHTSHEIKSEVHPYESETTILLLLDAIEALDGEAKELWDKCATRELNIGYDCGDEPWAFNQGWANSTLRRIASVGASLRITLYPYREP